MKNGRAAVFVNFDVMFIRWIERLLVNTHQKLLVHLL